MISTSICYFQNIQYGKTRKAYSVQKRSVKAQNLDAIGWPFKTHLKPDFSNQFKKDKAGNIIFYKRLSIFNHTFQNVRDRRFNSTNQDIKIPGIYLTHCKFIDSVDFNDIKYLSKDSIRKYQDSYLFSFLLDTFTFIRFNEIRGSVNLDRASVVNQMQFWNVKGDQVKLSDLNIQNDTAQISVGKSNSKYSFQYFTGMKYTKVSFIQDTINDCYFDIDKKLEVFITNSDVNKSLIFEPENDKSSVEKCSIINSKINIPEIDCENIKVMRIIDCKNFEQPLVLIKNKSKRLVLNLTGTDVSKVNFNFDDNLRLVFVIGTSSEQEDQIYQGLKEKYKRENKTISYENVDIQYQRHVLLRYGILGKIWNKVDLEWWNYGYSRWKIILWTTLFLVVFFIGNLLLSKQLFSFYPIFVDYDIGGFKSFSAAANTIVLTFVLTLYIFFSFKVDFEKLKASKTFLVLYFFIQFFVGLICLFFLLNAILKIN
ncbi:MAG: hypothetical protein ACXVPZ_17945 [Bacteroidia bacterium]